MIGNETIPSGRREVTKRIARAIFRYLLNDILTENPAVDALTLNSSPYGLPFYLALGFIPSAGAGSG